MSLQCEYAMSKFVMTNFEKSFRPDFGIHNQIQSFHSWDPLMYYDGLWAIQNTNRRHGLAVMFSFSTFQPPSLCSNKY